MANKNEIKRIALEKLDELIIGQLNELASANLGLDKFKLTYTRDYFTAEELAEISNNIQQLSNSDGIRSICLYRGINIPESIK